LPRDWRLDRESWHDTRWSWPIRELKEAALVPHRFQTWLGYGHTIIPNDIDASFQVRQSLDRSTRLSSLLVTTSELLPEAIHTIESGTQQIDLLMLLPMYPEELELRISHGAHALLDAFTTAGVSDVIDPARPSAIARADNC